MSILTKLFGDANQRFLNKLAERVDLINAEEKAVAAYYELLEKWENKS